MTATSGGPTATTGLPGGTPRFAWIDATRGYSVASVVLFHVVLWGYLRAGTPVAAGGLEVWGTSNSILGSVRMPVLLAVSGLVLARRIRTGPLRHGTLVRSARNYYLYVIWLGVYALFYALLPQPYLRHRVDGPVELMNQLVAPATTLWYLLAIALYSLILTVVRRWPAWLVLTLLGLLSTAIHAQTFPGQLWQKVPELFIFHAFGVYGAEPLRRIAERATVPRVLLAGVAAAGVTGLGRFTEGRAADAWLFVPRGAAFLVLAVLAVSVLVRWGPLRRLGVALGRHTLAIYVLHPLWIALLTILVVGPARETFEAILAHPVLAMAYPPVVTVTVIAISMPARHLAERAGLGWLFSLPASWEATPARLARRRRQPAVDLDDTAASMPATAAPPARSAPPLAPRSNESYRPSG